MGRFLIWFVFGFVFFGNAQFRYMDNQQAKILSESIIIVQLFDEGNQEGKEANTFLREYFAPNLKIGKEVQFKSNAEIDNLLQSRDGNKYAIIAHDKDEHDVLGRRKVNDIYRNNPIKSSNEYYAMATLTHYDIELHLYNESSAQGEFVTEVDFVHYYLRPEDYVFSAKQFNRLYNAALKGIPTNRYYQVEKALGKLETKTLLVDSSKVRFKLSKAKGYDSNYRFTDHKEIKTAIINHKEGFAYPLMIWSWQLNAYLWVIVDTETGEIYSTVTNGGVNYKKFGENEPPGIIGKGHFKYFDSKLANKINNRY